MEQPRIRVAERTHALVEPAPAARAAGGLSRILIPMDLTARSLRAAEYADSLAAEFGSELVFVHAVKNGWPLKRAAREVLNQLRARYAERRFRVREGEPVAVILETAAQEQCGAILMETRGAPAVARLLEGSVTAGVLREARVPVLAGAGTLAPLRERPIRSIVCGLSLRDGSEEVLRWSARMAERLNASLSVVHASKALGSNPAIPADLEWRAWLRMETRERIRALQEAAGTRADVWLEPGSPAETVPAVAERLRADLLVIGRSPRRRLLGDLRTLSYEIARGARCPVASV